MEQISFKFEPDEIELFYQNGAMYAYAPGAPFEEVPVELGDQILFPGQYVKRLGEKKRSRFVLEDGYLLRYVGKAKNSKNYTILLFSVNDTESDYYYAFFYIDRNTLAIIGDGFGRDIRLQTLEVFNCIGEKEGTT